MGILRNHKKDIIRESSSFRLPVSADLGGQSSLEGNSGAVISSKHCAFAEDGWPPKLAGGLRGARDLVIGGRSS